VGIDYGYGMMKIRTVPVVMPAKFNCWGNAGSTGSFMFYHPALDAYLIGSLNQFRYHSKGIRFMLRVIDRLVKNVGANS
jgi:D-alanyl-D-alanine carboxypeptidase